MKGDGSVEVKAARAGWEPRSECRDGEGMSVLTPGTGRGSSEEEAERCPRVPPDNQVSPALAPNRARCDLLGFSISSTVLPCSLLLKALVTSGCMSSQGGCLSKGEGAI